jgi:hypothetical protein
VIEAPFRGDPQVARRLAEVTERTGPAVVADIERIVSEPGPPPGGSTIPAATAEELVARHGLESTTELALLALPVAGAMARPPISGFRVAAVGIEAGGHLVIG